MALAVLAVVLALVPLAALATYTPWPLPTGIVLVSAGVCALVVLATGAPFLGACAGVACASAAFTLGTVREVFGAVAASREPRRRRRPRLRAQPRPQPVVDAQPWWVLDERDRDAA